MTRICCQQLAPVVGEGECNRALANAAIEQAVELGAEVVVLPELVTSGYMIASPGARSFKHVSSCPWSSRKRSSIRQEYSLAWLTRSARSQNH